MKKIKLFLYIAAVSILTVACDDAIDIRQPSELLPEDTFETVGDLQTGIGGVYGSVPGEDVILFTSLFTDEVKLGRANGGQGTSGELAFLLNNQSGDAASIWLSNNTLINRANRLLLGASTITPVVSDEGDGIDETDAYNKVIAEAKVLRAYGHFQLLTFFSPDMKDDNALGTIITDHVPTTKEQLPRNTNAEVFAFIEKDLADAEASKALPKKAGVTGGFVSQDLITAIRARMAVYRGKYDQAEAYINTLISGYPLAAKGTGLNLGSAADLSAKSAYFKMFRDPATGGTTEVIFKALRSVAATEPTGNFYQAWSSVNSTITGGAFFEVSTALYQKYSADDIRRAVVIDPTSFPSFAVRPVGKYAESETVPLLGDIKLFRMSEMYLLKAECRANANDFAGVAEQVNKVRAARFGNTSNNIAVPANAQQAWAAILDERRIEFAFEGFRYIDIKRLGKLAGKGIDRNENDFAFNEAYTLDLDDHRWTLPIPRPEQSANRNIQQNPGYN